MHTRVLHPGELNGSERDIWDGFLRADPSLASPFLTPEFARAVGAARDDAWVAVIGDARSPDAFF